MISDAALREFKEVWLAEFGFPLPDDVAVEEAVALLTMMDKVYRPLKQEEVDAYENEYGTYLSKTE